MKTREFLLVAAIALVFVIAFWNWTAACIASIPLEFISIRRLQTRFQADPKNATLGTRYIRAMSANDFIVQIVCVIGAAVLAIAAPAYGANGWVAFGIFVAYCLFWYLPHFVYAAECFIKPDRVMAGAFAPPTLPNDHVAEQFAHGAWRLWAWAIVGGLAYATWYYAVGLGSRLLFFAWDHLHFMLPVATAWAFLFALRAIATVAVVLGLSRILPASTPASFGFRLPTHADLVLATRMFAGLLVSDFVLLGLIQSLGGREVVDHKVVANNFVPWMIGHHGWGDYLSDIIGIAVATPIVEETLFRGLLFAGLLQRMPVWAAAIVSALAFAAWHHDWYGFLPLFISGLVLAFVYYRTRTLWAPIAVHALGNAVGGSITSLLNNWPH